MSNPKDIFESNWIPIINSILFLSFCYLAYDKTTDFIIACLGGTFIISIFLSLRGRFYGFGKVYVRWASFPVVICLILGFLLGTGLIWWILGMFGIFGYEPN
ncbi:hypothetical protein D7Z94_09740 [Ulvibacterium marinum]|uniref:Uncharacterized protein n=1 Tax=Ulvibacterium marinum TaxID=2419782 RepID=A0A3B0C587_9FLAO|nr:hypothetical protein D7Z94_09740 [Ulvibacterium marinum]